MAEMLALPTLLRQAGAAMIFRDGRAVPAHYGSAPGELAVCMRSVGIAHRPDLAALSISGSARGLDQLLARVVGRDVAPGGATLEGGAWWCRSNSNPEIVVICRRGSVPRLIRSLRFGVSGFGSARLADDSEERVVFNIIGRRTEAVLAELGGLGPEQDPRDVTPYSVGSIKGHAVRLLIEGSTGAFVLVAPASTADVWQAIQEAGRPHGISCVGLEAIERYALLERAARGSMALL